MVVMCESNDKARWDKALRVLTLVERLNVGLKMVMDVPTSEKHVDWRFAKMMLDGSTNIRNTKTRRTHGIQTAWWNKRQTDDRADTSTVHGIARLTVRFPASGRLDDAVSHRWKGVCPE